MASRVVATKPNRAKHCSANWTSLGGLATVLSSASFLTAAAGLPPSLVSHCDLPNAGHTLATGFCDESILKDDSEQDPRCTFSHTFLPASSACSSHGTSSH